MLAKDVKKNYFIIMTAAAIAGYIVICSLGQTIHKEKEYLKQEAAAASELPVYCTVREMGGKLAVFRRDPEVPYMTLDVRISMLSDHDREQFEQGVELHSEAELKKLIEDFSD
jgi:steroid 5-alpha reductase family enzyme